VILTGFEEYELLGTGMLMPYYDELLRIIGAGEAGALLGALSGMALPGVAADDDEGFRRIILDSSSTGQHYPGIDDREYFGGYEYPMHPVPASYLDQMLAGKLDGRPITANAIENATLVLASGAANASGTSTVRTMTALAIMAGENIAADLARRS
jgi:hypothetical protein